MKGKSLILIAVALLAAALLFTACNKQNDGHTGLYVFVTDENGNVKYDENGEPLTEEWITDVIYATNADGETYTNSSGEKVTVKQTRPAYTSVVYRTRPVTDENGVWQTNKDGSYVTVPMTMRVTEFATDKSGNRVTQAVTDEDGSKVTEPNGQVVTEAVTVERTEKVTHTVALTLDNMVTKYHTTQKNSTTKTTSIYENPEYTATKTTNPNKVTIPSTGKFASTRSWLKGFGGSLDDRYRKVLPVGKGFAAMGLTYSTDGTFKSFSQTGFYSVLTKFDKDGNVLWHCPVGSSGFTRMHDFAILSDGSYILVGESNAGDLGYDNPNGNYGALMVKISSDGNVLWYKHIGGTKPDYFTAVAATDDGGFVASGKTSSTDGDFSGLDINNTDAVTVKFSSDGSIEWAKKFGGSGIDSGAAIAVDTKGCIYTACRTISKDGDAKGSDGSVDIFVVKYSPSGEQLWSQLLKGSKSEEVEDMYAGSDGCVIVGRYASSDGVFGINRGSYDAYMAHIKADGTLNWVRTYGGLKGERFYSVIPTSFGYAAVGITYSDNRDFGAIGNKGGSDAFIMSIDKKGNVLDVASISGTGNDGCYDICKLDSKTFIVVGETYKTDGAFASIKPTAGDKNSTAFIAKYEIY